MFTQVAKGEERQKSEGRSQKEWENSTERPSVSAEPPGEAHAKNKPPVGLSDDRSIHSADGRWEVKLEQRTERLRQVIEFKVVIYKQEPLLKKSANAPTLEGTAGQASSGTPFVTSTAEQASSGTLSSGTVRQASSGTSPMGRVLLRKTPATPTAPNTAGQASSGASEPSPYPTNTVFESATIVGEGVERERREVEERLMEIRAKERRRELLEERKEHVRFNGTDEEFAALERIQFDEEGNLIEVGKRPGPRWKLTPEVIRKILAFLATGVSRREAAKRVGVATSTITLHARRDDSFNVRLLAAEAQGKEFKRIYEGLFTPFRVVLERNPVLSTPQFEYEKQYLISKGLSREWVSRMRLRDPHEAAWLLNNVQFMDPKLSSRSEKSVNKLLEEGRKSLADQAIVRKVISNKGGQNGRKEKVTVEITRHRTVGDQSELSNEELVKLAFPELEFPNGVDPMPSLPSWSDMERAEKASRRKQKTVTGVCRDGSLCKQASKPGSVRRRKRLAKTGTR